MLQAYQNPELVDLRGYIKYLEDERRFYSRTRELNTATGRSFEKLESYIKLLELTDRLLIVLNNDQRDRGAEYGMLGTSQALSRHIAIELYYFIQDLITN